MYIQSLRISNLRSFRDAELAFQYPGRRSGASAAPNVNLLLGNNGTGKTTVLRAIALAVLSPVITSSGFVPFRLVRRTPAESPTRAAVTADVLLHGQDLGSKNRRSPVREQVSAFVERTRDIEQVSGSPHTREHWENIYVDDSPAFLVVGYGASRRVETATTYDASLRSKSRQLRYERVAGLFEEHVTLTPLGGWLPKFQTGNPGRYSQVVELLNDLLPEECRFTEGTERDDYLFELRGVPVPFGALSDGYRAYIGWVADLLYHICTGAPSGAKLVDNRGIVLVDEIDLHLHPEWQRSVIPRLSAALPNLQFVLTSHSPIVVGTLESQNVFVMEFDQSGASVISKLQESVHGRSAEQILLSPYFNLESTRAPAAEKQLSELARKAHIGDPRAAIEHLRTLTEGMDSSPEEAAATSNEP